MQTIKIISNVSYNSDEFFEATVKRLEANGVIDWCYWIRHDADTDETKPHIHFVLKPSARLDTQKLREQFKEIDLSHPTEPLCCTKRWFSTNSMEDWLLYGVHDVAYLASKGQTRKHHYGFEDIKSTDPDGLRQDWNMIDRSKYDRLQILFEAAQRQIPFGLLVQMGRVPIPQRAQWEMQYNSLLALVHSEDCMRVLSHEVDMMTGELLYVDNPNDDSEQKEGD